jgi:hypothetical protein
MWNASSPPRVMGRSLRTLRHGVPSSCHANYAVINAACRGEPSMPVGLSKWDMSSICRRELLQLAAAARHVLPLPLMHLLDDALQGLCTTRLAQAGFERHLASKDDASDELVGAVVDLLCIARFTPHLAHASARMLRHDRQACGSADGRDPVRCTADAVLSGLANASFACRRTTLLHACVQVRCSYPCSAHWWPTSRRSHATMNEAVTGEVAGAQVLPCCTPCEFSHLADDLLPALVTRTIQPTPSGSLSMQQQVSTAVGCLAADASLLDLVGRAFMVLLDSVDAAGADDGAVEALARHLAVLCTRALKAAVAVGLEDARSELEDARIPRTVVSVTPEAAVRHCLVVTCTLMQHPCSSPGMQQILVPVALQAIEALASASPGSEQDGEHEHALLQFVGSVLDGLPSTPQLTLRCAAELKFPTPKSASGDRTAGR